LKPSIALFEGDRRFAVVVRLPDAQRDDLETLGVIPVMLPAAEARLVLPAITAWTARLKIGPMPKAKLATS
jgi:Cu/Ag efflux pump CusA